MSDNQYQNQNAPLRSSAETAQTSVGGRSGENTTQSSFGSNTAQTSVGGRSGENTTQSSFGSNTAQTSVGGGSGENGSSVGCCQKMMTACKDLCNRFMSARVGISYDVTTRMICGEGQGTAQGQPNNNVMTKQGEMEIRMADLAIGTAGVCAFMTVMCAVKRMCCCKGKRKC